MERSLDTTSFPRWKLLLAAWGAFAISLFVPCLKVNRSESDLAARPLATTSGSSSYRAKVEIYYATFAIANTAMVITPAILALVPRRASVLRRLRAPLVASGLLVASFFPHALLMTHFAIRTGALLWLASFVLLAFGTERARRDLRALEQASP